MKINKGSLLLIISLTSRIFVLLLLCFFARLTIYNNFKLAYNNPRLVELDAGETERKIYENTNSFFLLFGEDPLKESQKNGGMTWSIRIMGVPFTDPIAAISVIAKHHHLAMSIALGLIGPLLVALLFGRVFCSYICPASLLFFCTARIRRLLKIVLLRISSEISLFGS